ncbi:hypothetical protein DSECCO2_470200 [anaerobic digester metagenome]
MARKGSFANIVRELLQARGRASVSELVTTIVAANPEQVAGRKVRPMVQAVMRDLLRSGEAARVAEGEYRWAARKEPVQLRQKMWSILRARRTVSIEDLMELTGASRNYARAWTTMLEGHEVVRRLEDGRVQLVNDPVVMPSDTTKAAKLRAIRIRKALATVRDLAGLVQVAVKELEEAVS